MALAILALTCMAALAGAGLMLLARLCPRDDKSLSAQIDALLPQTQCAQCGFPGCAPYAAAIAANETDINRCPPGGNATVIALAALLGTPARAIAADVPVPVAPQIAFIDEAACIGCTLCLAPCPVDAIVGAQRMMHTVLIDSCTGCELCVEPCPVDCIIMVPAPARVNLW